MKTCLVVDDSRVVRKVARRIVEDLGFKAEEAEDGVVALEKCKAGMPEAILLDWNMPNMTGIEFLRALRAESNGGAPIVIFCTTENEMSFIQEALQAGANEYIMKPFDSDIVQTKFEQTGLL
jgi:two-component system chemotaxis response regulator CheY